MFEFYTITSQFYVIPTIKVTYDKTLYGYYTLDLVWLKGGLSLIW